MAIPRSLRSPAAFAVASTLLAAILRCLDFQAVDLWQDEANEIFLVQGTLGEVLERITRSEMRPPGRFLLLKAWLLGGQGTDWVRLPSWAFSVAAVPLLYAASRRLAGEGTARLATVLLACASFPLSSAHFARSYAMDLFLTLLAVYAFAKLAERRTAARHVGFVVASLLALYTTYFFGFVLAVMGLFHLRAVRRGDWTGRELVTLWAPLLIGSLPLLALIFEQWGNARTHQWHQKSASGALLWLYLHVLGAGRLKNWTDFSFAQGLVALLCMGLASAGAWRGLRRPGAGAQPAFALLWFALPVLTIFTFSLFSLSLFTIRTLLICAPAYYLLVAEGLGLLRAPWMRWFAVAAFAVVNLHGFLTTEDLRSITHGSRAAAEFLRAHPLGAQRVVHAQHFSYFPMRLYARELDQVVFQKEVPWNWGGAQVPAEHHIVGLEALREAPGFWFVRKRDHYQEPRGRWLAQISHLATVWPAGAPGRIGRFRADERLVFESLVLTHYTREEVPGSLQEGPARLRAELESLLELGVYPTEEDAVWVRDELARLGG